MLLLPVTKTLTSKIIIFNYFRGYPNKYTFAVKGDFHTSMVKGIIPDKYTLDRHNEQSYISPELQNNVRNMLFK
ncbi:MAG: hypothetical protein MJ252_17475 [archaeon]|nr:hypothetical protein [archaeon]